MTNVSTPEGLISCVLVFICSCAHIRRIKALKPIINTAVKQFGPLSIFHKASVIGMRLQVPVAIVVETCESGHQTCMCGLLICSSYCPAKYADSYEILDNNDNLAPYLGSNWDSIDSMFDFAEITNNSRVLDLGAGDGRVLIRAIQRGAELAVGYELNKSVFELGRNHIDKYYDTTELSKNNDCRNIKIYNEDCRNIKSFNDYNLVTLFLLPEGLRMLEPFLSTHLCDKSEDSSKKKITVVSLGWPIPNWEIKKQTVSRFGTNIFLYYKYSA